MLFHAHTTTNTPSSPGFLSLIPPPPCIGWLLFSLIPAFPSCQGHWNNPLVPAINQHHPPPPTLLHPSAPRFPAAPPVFSEHPGEENCHVRSSGERIDTENVQTAPDIGITEPAHIYSLQPCLSGCLSVCYICVCVCVCEEQQLYLFLFFFNPFGMQAEVG